MQVTKISEVTASDIQMDLANVARANGISQGILDDLFCIWNQIFKTALKMDLIYRNPMDRVDKLHVTKKRNVQRISETDLDTLLIVCNGLITRTKNDPRLLFDATIISYALKVSWFTALRPAEVLGLEYESVDLNRKILRVYQEVGMDSNRQPIIRSTKTERSNRVVPLTDEACKLFEEIKKFQKHGKYLFADYNGDLLTSTRTADKISRVCKSEGVDFNWYCLRHQYSTDMQRNNASLSVTAKGMGHENISMTYQYTRMPDEDLREAMNRLGRTLSKEII